MLSDQVLSELEVDALKEIFNIGIGRSAAALNRMINQTVELSIPDVQLIDMHQIGDTLRTDNNGLVSAVTQRFDGDFSGQAILIFSQENGLALVRKLLGDDLPLASLSDLEQDSLVEIGNIILNACFGTVINFLHASISIDMPVFQQRGIDEFYANTDQQEHCLYVKVKFMLPDDSIEGIIAFVMDIRSQETFKQLVRDFVAGYTGSM